MSTNPITVQSEPELQYNGGWRRAYGTQALLLGYTATWSSDNYGKLTISKNGQHVANITPEGKTFKMSELIAKAETQAKHLADEKERIRNSPRQPNAIPYYPSGHAMGRRTGVGMSPRLKFAEAIIASGNL